MTDLTTLAAQRCAELTGGMALGGAMAANPAPSIQAFIRLVEQAHHLTAACLRALTKYRPEGADNAE